MRSNVIAALSDLVTALLLAAALSTLALRLTAAEGCAPAVLPAPSPRDLPPPPGDPAGPRRAAARSAEV